MLIPRPAVIAQIARALAIHPVAALLGPRQCGKTTVARMIEEQQPSTYFDLENPVDVRRLSAPLTVLETMSGLVIIDEVQRRPELLQLLRVLVDRPHNSARFLLLGSASPQLVRGASESLAGRVAVRVARRVLAQGLPPDTLLNVNVPNRKFEALKGFRLTRQGRRTYDNAIRAVSDPRGRTHYWQGGGTPVWTPGAETDIHAVNEGWVSITPIHLDLTNYEALKTLEKEWSPWDLSHEASE